MNPLAPYLGIAKAVAVVALLLGLFAAGMKVGSDHVQGKWNVAKLEQAEADQAAVEVARLKERSWSKQVEDARNDAAKRETTLRRDAAGSRAAADGLRDELGEIRRQLPSLAADACRSRADTLAELFGQCTAEYRSLAESADRISSDKQTLMAGWPE